MNMKEIIKTILITIIMVALFFVFAYQQTHYIRVGHVVKSRSFGVENYYLFTDNTGHSFEFITTDSIDTDAIVKATMFDNCTEEYVEDDMVVNYKIISDSKIENEK